MAKLDHVAAIETHAREACAAGDYESAAAHVFKHYGPEIRTFLLAKFRGDASATDEVFSEFAENFWTGLPKFEWRCSLRGWSYKIALHAAHRFRRSHHNRGERRIPLSQAGLLEELVQKSKTPSLPSHDEFQRLRERLSPEDQDLLILRVDRELSWREVAYAFPTDEKELDEEGRRLLEQRLRQRFVEVKRRLRALAIDAGLLEPDGHSHRGPFR